MTRSEFFVSRARWDFLARRFAAEAGLALGSRAMDGLDSLPQLEWTPLGSGAVPPRGRYNSRVVRLSWEVLLIHAEGWTGTEPGRYRQVGLYWAMDPVVRLSAQRGIVESGGPARVEAGSTVDSSLIRDTPAPWAEASCERFGPDVDGLFDNAPLPAHGELYEDSRAVLGPEQGRGVGPPRLPSLGLLGHEALLEAADLHVSGTVSPGPIGSTAQCTVSAPTNWGAPLDASHACVQYRPVVAAAGSLIVSAGQGQGVLLIPGDASFRGARYYGLVVVGGDLEVTDGSQLHGLVRVRGAVTLRGGSRIVGSACAALSALDAARKLRSLAPVPWSVWPDSR